MRSVVTCYRFVTHVGGFPLTTGIVADRRGGMDILPDAGLADLADLANADTQACAYGKIAAIADDGIQAFQVMPDGRLSPAFCGNSTAAAIACIDLSSDLITRVPGPGSNAYSISATMRDGAVGQTWFLPQPVVEEIDWQGRRVVLVRALNDYAIVMDRLPEGVCPDEARTQLLGQAGCGKLAIVESAAEAPLVRFFNSNGQHGAAPQTGLASIALAAMAVDWFGQAFLGRRISFMTKAGLRTVDLPGLRKAGHGTQEVEFAPIAVDLTPFAGEVAA